MVGSSMNLLCTIRAILSEMEGMSASASDRGLIEVSASFVAFTIAAVACTGFGLALLTENACAGHNRQSEDRLIWASAGLDPGPISAETSKVRVSQYRPSLATNGLLKVMLPALPVKIAGLPKPCPSPTRKLVRAETGVVAVNPPKIA